MEKKAKIAIKVIAVIVVLLIAYLMLPYIMGVVENPPGSTIIVLPKKINFEFERIVDISAGSFTVNFTIPENNTFQHIVVNDLSNEIKTVHHAYNKTWWSYSSVGSARYILRYNGTTFLKVWNIKNSEDASSIPESLKRQYNHAEFIDVGDGTRKVVIDPAPFRSVTLNITSAKHGVVNKLRAIYDVIVKNFKYKTERNGMPRSAVETWNSGSGDCDELSFVFVSMARSIGIPAWMEYGLLYDGHTWVGHAWVRSVIPHDGSVEEVNIDVTMEVGREDLGRGFLIRDPYRITLWVEDGNSKHLSAYYRYITYTTPPPLDYNEEVKVIYLKESDNVTVPVGETIPSWLMLLIVLLIIMVVIVIIIRW